MLIHAKNHATNIDEKSVQPNAVDIRCSKLFQIMAEDIRIQISENTKEFFPQHEIYAETTLGREIPTKTWRLDPLASYQFETNHIVTVPEGMAGWLIIRSTLSRNGIIMSGGLYDQGFKGNIGGTIHNLTSGTVLLEENCRIAQFVMAASEGDHMYTGFYNTKE